MALDQLVDLSEFQRMVAVIFPSQASLRWFLRIHRAELVKAGALVQLAGKNFIHPERFAAAALEIGAHTATTRRRGRAA